MSVGAEAFSIETGEVLERILRPKADVVDLQAYREDRTTIEDIRRERPDVIDLVGALQRVGTLSAAGELTLQAKALTHHPEFMRWSADNYDSEAATAAIETIQSGLEAAKPVVRGLYESFVYGNVLKSAELISWAKHDRGAAEMLTALILHTKKQSPARAAETRALARELQTRYDEHVKATHLALTSQQPPVETQKPPAKKASQPQPARPRVIPVHAVRAADGTVDMRSLSESLESIDALPGNRTPAVDPASITNFGRRALFVTAATSVVVSGAPAAAEAATPLQQTAHLNRPAAVADRVPGSVQEAQPTEKQPVTAAVTSSGEASAILQSIDGSAALAQTTHALSDEQVGQLRQEVATARNVMAHTPDDVSSTVLDVVTHYFADVSSAPTPKVPAPRESKVAPVSKTEAATVNQKYLKVLLPAAQHAQIDVRALKGALAYFNGNLSVVREKPLRSREGWFGIDERQWNNPENNPHHYPWGDREDLAKSAEVAATIFKHVGAANFGDTIGTPEDFTKHPGLLRTLVAYVHGPETVEDWLEHGSLTQHERNEIEQAYEALKLAGMVTETTLPAKPASASMIPQMTLHKGTPNAVSKPQLPTHPSAASSTPSTNPTATPKVVPHTTAPQASKSAPHLTAAPSRPNIHVQTPIHLAPAQSTVPARTAEAPHAALMAQSTDNNIDAITFGGADLAARVRTAIAELERDGATPQGAAMVAGNFIGESSLRTSAVGDKNIPGGDAEGIGQWRGKRKVGLPSTLTGQIDFGMNELAKGYPGLFAEITGKKPATEAEIMHGLVFDYERPRDPAADTARRLKVGKAIYDQMKTPVVTSAPTSIPSQPKLAPAAKIQGGKTAAAAASMDSTDKVGGIIKLSQRTSSVASLVYSSTGNKHQTIAEGGCEVVSAAAVVTSLTKPHPTTTDGEQEVKKIAHQNVANGYRTANSGTANAAIIANMTEAGLHAATINPENKTAVEQALRQGAKLIITATTADPQAVGTRSGHVYVVAGVHDQNGQVVADVMDPKNTNKTEYPLDKALEGATFGVAVTK